MPNSDYLDLEALSDWMKENVPGFQGPVAITKFSGGQSNPTYKISTPAGNYVLRRKPRGKLLKGAHAVDREARIISALHSIGFPTPRVYGLCTDDSVIGTWFYVMQMMEGRIFWDLTLPEIPKNERIRYFDAMNATIAALHKIDYHSIGLSDYGREGSFLERQIKLWSRQYLAMEAEAGRDPHIDRLIAWLPENIPGGDETSIVHGDFRIDNMIFDPVEPRVIAVLDWELSTLGHPLVDFAYHLMMFRMPKDLRAGLATLDLAEYGLPSEESYVGNYCRRTGRKGIDSLNFYLAFNFFRFAAICHGIRARLALGNAASDDAAQMAEQFPRLAELAWQQAVVAGAR